MKMVDFHSHVLPGIDDGAANLDMTKALLLSQKEQGIETVVATPHFYCENTVDNFLSNRDEALSLVQTNLGEDFPHLVAGAEVEFYCGLSRLDNLEKLCIGDTDYMLIEMPFCFWNDWYYDELDELIMGRSIKPIIAHLDRYLANINEVRNVEKLFARNVVIQINAESVLHSSFRKILKKILKTDMPIILGSDCHDPKRRTCQIENAAKIIKKKYGAKCLDRMLLNAEKILNNQSPDEED